MSDNSVRWIYVVWLSRRVNGMDNDLACNLGGRASNTLIDERQERLSCQDKLVIKHVHVQLHVRAHDTLTCSHRHYQRRVALSCAPERALLRTHGLESTLMQRCAHGSAPVGALPWAQHALCASD